MPRCSTEQSEINRVRGVSFDTGNEENTDDTASSKNK